MNRKSEGKVLGGVCGGISRQVSLDPNVMRLLFGAFTLLTAGLVVIVYLGLWLILPLDSTGKTGLTELGELFETKPTQNPSREENVPPPPPSPVRDSRAEAEQVTPPPPAPANDALEESGSDTTPPKNTSDRDENYYDVNAERGKREATARSSGFSPELPRW